MRVMYGATLALAGFWANQEKIGGVFCANQHRCGICRRVVRNNLGRWLERQRNPSAYVPAEDITPRDAYWFAA